MQSFHDWSEAKLTDCCKPTPIHIKFEISEKDYQRGWLQAIMPRDRDPKLYKFYVGFPLVGLLTICLAIFARYDSVLSRTSTFVFGLVILSIPFCVNFLLSRRIKKYAKLEYRKTAAIQGKLCADVDDEGLKLTGENFSWNAKWADFREFIETRKVFVLFQRNQQRPAVPPIFVHVFPKRAFSPDQVAEFRQYLQHKIASKTKPAR